MTSSLRLLALSVLTVLCLGLSTTAARAQAPESELAPKPGEFDPEEYTAPATGFAIPDVATAIEKKTQVKSKWFTMKFGLVTLADYTAFSQDAASVEQVGVQENQWNARAARVMVRGGMGKVKYLAAAEYKGFESEPEQTWQFVNDDDFDDSGTDATVRLTGLVWSADKDRSYLHVGSSWRYFGADNDTMRYKGRPESNVTSNYVDSGNLSGDHARHLGFEGLWNVRGWSLMGEYIQAWVRSDISGDPTFKGYYVTTSYVLTGENRPYDRTVGYARRVMPTRKWGAPELVFRVAHEDIDDGSVQGGTFNKTYLGVNWWATRRWKFGVGWNYTILDRFQKEGRTHAVLTRFQWVY
jgi:hypothetical protein